MPNLKSVAKLKKELDSIFSLYIRYRDGFKRNGLWYSQCITCGVIKPIKQGMQCGHFMSRVHNSTRYDEENCNAQCVGCNMFHGGEQYKYSIMVDKKYGKGTAEKLSIKCRELKQYKGWELIELIEKYKAKVKEYESR